MPFIETTSASPTEDELVDATLRQVSKGNGCIQLPSSSQILERLYNDHGVRVRMIRRNRPRKIPTVRELIDTLSKKHERLLAMGKGAKIETQPIRDRHRVGLESLTDHTVEKDETSVSHGKDLKTAGMTDLNLHRLAVLPATKKSIEGLAEYKGRLDPLLGPEKRDDVTDRFGGKDIIVNSYRKR